MRSMTGMGAATVKGDGAVVKVEIRSVNHRFFDLSVRAPSRLGVYESLIRERVAARLHRGRVTLSVELDLQRRHGEVIVDEEYVASFLRAARRLARRHGLPGEIEIAQVVSLPEVFTVRERSLPERTMRKLLLQAVDEALDRLDAMRAKEGRALVRELRRRCKAVSAHRKVLIHRTRNLPARLRRRLQQRLAEVGAQDVVDPQRLAQEVVLLAEKATVSEEWGFAPSYDDLLALVVARALREFPYMNARLSEDGTAIERLPDVNMGMAVDTERGLLVPVIRNIDQKGLRAFGTEFRALVERAREGKSLPDDLQGGTFTITNLGLYDIDAFTPMINLPEAAILGVGRIRPQPVVRDGAIVIRQMWLLSLVFDHRLVDGAPAARFLQRIKQLIESPFLLLG